MAAAPNLSTPLALASSSSAYLQGAWRGYSAVTRVAGVGLCWGGGEPTSSRPPLHAWNFREQRRYLARSTRRGRRRPDSKKEFQLFDDYPVDEPPKKNKNVLVIGSAGVLGRTLVSHLGHAQGWNVLGADVLEPRRALSDKPRGMRDYISLPIDGSAADLASELHRGVSLGLPEGGDSREGRLDAVVCVSGGWAGDVDLKEMSENHRSNGSSDEEYVRDSAHVCELMIRKNYYPVVAASLVGRRFMKMGGLFVSIGASAALSPTPGMLGYGSSKSAAHHYLQSFGATSMDENDITTIGILPLMIDTPANRATLGGDDGDSGDDRYSKMVKPGHIAKEIGEWIKEPLLRPHSGSLVKVISSERSGGSGGAAFHLVR